MLNVLACLETCPEHQEMSLESLGVAGKLRHKVAAGQDLCANEEAVTLSMKNNYFIRNRFPGVVGRRQV